MHAAQPQQTVRWFADLETRVNPTSENHPGLVKPDGSLRPAMAWLVDFLAR